MRLPVWAGRGMQGSPRAGSVFQGTGKGLSDRFRFFLGLPSQAVEGGGALDLDLDVCFYPVTNSQHSLREPRPSRAEGLGSLI